MLFVWIPALLALLSEQASAEPGAFQNWFPSFRDYLDAKVEHVCQPAYETYLTDPTCSSCRLDYPRSGPHRAKINVINCLLNNTDEYIKANFGVGTVVLGLLPTVLSFSGSTTTEIGLLALRRPLLATILALSSPSIYPIRALDYDDPVAPLRRGHTPFALTRAPSSAWLRIVTVVEYVFALAATANVAAVIWALCINSPSSLGPDLLFWPLLWPLTSLIVYALGTLYIWLRVQLAPKANTVKEKVSMELSSSAAHEVYTPPVHPQTFLSGLLAWLASILTICHIIFGTAVLSSLLFISVVDAVYVALRLWASAVVARTVVMYELSSMALTLNIPM